MRLDLFPRLAGLILALATSAHAAGGVFQLRNEVVTVPEAGAVTNVALRTDTAQMTFVPPAGWRMRIEPVESRITWTSPDFTSVLVLQVRPDADGAWRAAPGLKGREQLARELADFEVTDEFTCFTSGLTGRALEIRRLTDGQESAAGRVAVIPMAGAVAQIRLIHPASQRAGRQIEFGMFLNSFRASAAGKL